MKLLYDMYLQSPSFSPTHKSFLFYFCFILLSSELCNWLTITPLPKGIDPIIPILSEIEEARAVQYRCECLEAACLRDRMCRQSAP